MAEAMIAPFKRCTKCNVEMPSEPAFFASRAKNGALASWCRNCHNRHQREKAAASRVPKAPAGETKICAKCRVQKERSVECFPPCKKASDKLSSWCRECHSKSRQRSASRPTTERPYKKRQSVSRESLIALCAGQGLTIRACAQALGVSDGVLTRALKREGLAPGVRWDRRVSKTCVDCGVPFSVIASQASEYSRCPLCRGTNRWGVQSRQTHIACAECSKTVTRSSAYANSRTRLFCDAACHARWRSKNVRGEKHPQWRGGAQAKYRRVEADPAKRLRRRISNQIWWSLRGQKGGRSWETLVGYTLEQLKRHLERQFTKGMSWANMGQWHIDHILPVASFNIGSCDNPDFRACWALTNLRPLWGKENISKGAKIITLL